MQTRHTPQQPISTRHVPHTANENVHASVAHPGLLIARGGGGSFSCPKNRTTFFVHVHASVADSGLFVFLPKKSVLNSTPLNMSLLPKHPQMVHLTKFSPLPRKTALKTFLSLRGGVRPNPTNPQDLPLCMCCLKTVNDVDEVIIIIMIQTYCAARRDRVATEHVTGHANDFRFHLSDIRKDVGMQRIGPCKLGIHLNNQSELGLYLTQPMRRCMHLAANQHIADISQNQSNLAYNLHGKL